jgi:nucleotide-binding universal stress UspA family protein
VTRAAAEFKRIVLGLDWSASGGAAVELAAEFAELLELEILGLFLRDESLLGLADFPFARELRMPCEWHPISVEQLARDIDLAGQTARQLFEAAAKQLRTASSFKVVSGSPARVIASLAQQDDIMAIVEPSGPAARATEPFVSFLDAALRSAASVLLLPSRVARRTGPIAAIALSANDPSTETAAAIAGSANEEMIIIRGYRDPDKAPWPRTKARFCVLPMTHPHYLAAAFENLHERMVVMSRSVCKKVPPSVITAVRRVPVLITTSSVGSY